MEWAPAFSFDVGKVALPADEVTVPSEVVVSLKVMLPEIEPATLELTDAVKVTVWPKVEGFNKDERVVVVATVFTGCVVATEIAW
jgi:hypothetical protein